MIRKRMAKSILTKITILITLSTSATVSAFCVEAAQPNSYTATVRALAANRSLLAKSENESLSKILKEDREKLFKSLPAELQAFELMKDQLIEKANRPQRPRARQPVEKPRSPKTVPLHQKALQFVANDNLKDAARIYEQIVLVDPDDDEAYILMGHSYFMIGEYAKAEAAYHNAVSIDPENRKEIAPFYENFILQNPSDDVAYTNLGYAYLMLGDASKARDAFKDALSIQPDNRNAQIGIRHTEK